MSMDISEFGDDLNKTIRMTTENTTITGNCVMTNEEYSVTVKTQEYMNWQQGMLIQEAMPSVSIEDKEFLISGVSPLGWRDLFNEEGV